MKQRVCKRCNGRGKTFEKKKGVDGICGWGKYKWNSTDPDGETCKSCNGTGFKN